MQATFDPTTRKFSLPIVKKIGSFQETSIAWATHSLNFLRAIHKTTGKVGWGCQKVDEACQNCYSEAMNLRFGTGEDFSAAGMKNIETVFDEARLYAALTWKIPKGFIGKAGDGRPKCFPMDMTDLFGDFVPESFVDRFMALVALRPDIDFLVLTKRPERMEFYTDIIAPTTKGESERIGDMAWGMRARVDRKVDMESLYRWPLPNLWLGTSVGNQKRADERIPSLLRCPAAVHFISYEPMLGEIDLLKSIGGTQWIGGQRGCGATHRGMGSVDCPREPHHHHDDRCRKGLDFLIAGCESGPHRRTAEQKWFESAANQCDGRTNLFIKQMEINGQVTEDITKFPKHLQIRQWPNRLEEVSCPPAQALFDACGVPKGKFYRQP